MERYLAQPFDVYRYALPLLLAGASLTPTKWWLVGFVLLGFGVLLGVWVIVAGLTEQYVSYWERIADAAKTLDRTRNPEVWDALGFELPKKVAEQWLLKEPETPNSYAVALFSPALSTPKMTAFADGVLLGKSLAETAWAGKGKPLSSEEVRSLKMELRKHKLIRRANEKNERLGDCLTAKGRRELLKYASPGVQLQLERGQVAPQFENFE